MITSILTFLFAVAFIISQVLIVLATSIFFLFGFVKLFQPLFIRATPNTEKNS